MKRKNTKTKGTAKRKLNTEATKPKQSAKRKPTPQGAGVPPPAHGSRSDTVGAKAIFSQSADAPHDTKDELMDKARSAIEGMGQLFRDLKEDAEKKALERDMNILLGHVAQELRSMGHASPGLSYLTLRREAITRIEILKKRGVEATDEDFRLSGVEDLGMILHAALDALALLAVEHKDFQAVRYLAYLSELGKHRLPKGATMPLEKAIKKLSGAHYAEWSRSKKARAILGLRAPREQLGVWTQSLYRTYQNLCLTMIYDVKTDEFIFEDVDSECKAWTAFLGKQGLLPDAVRLPVGAFDLKMENFVEALALPMLKAIKQLNEPLWKKLVGSKYRDSRLKGSDRWQTIKKKMLKALKEKI